MLGSARVCAQGQTFRILARLRIRKVYELTAQLVVFA
jgi:hypothetical protein